MFPRGVPPRGVPPRGVDPRGVEPPISLSSFCRCLAHSSAALAQSVPAVEPGLATEGEAPLRGVLDTGVGTAGVCTLAGVRDTAADDLAGVRDTAGVRGVAPGHALLRGVGWYEGVAAAGVVMWAGATNDEGVIIGVIIGVAIGYKRQTQRFDTRCKYKTHINLVQDQVHSR